AESCRGHLACNEACIRLAPVALDCSRPAPLGAWARQRAGEPSAPPRPDAGFEAWRSQSDATGLALQGMVAELTPRLADSAKRLDELTPKSGQPAPATDVAAKDLENEKQRHDRLDAHLRAARP